ncbi:MAG: hypothetical protein CVU24_06360 [Betaproteobacteria bacterium HGW-Betaproteobacteria-18]|nr:MAG: hypothetical protein CVU24_06360 [Betaproteobacteria bacterium HGW-Betaproteobacteria-18]
MKFNAVLFDCDGVLVDSEPMTNQVLRDMLEVSGWSMTLTECMSFFAGRVFSGHEMPRSKPAPDVYLAAAGHLNVPGHQCLVIEDTHVGVTAGVAAGATVWAYSPQPVGDVALLLAGASQVFRRMDDVPELLAAR